MITEKMLTHWASLTLSEGLTASLLHGDVNWQQLPNGDYEKPRFLNHLASLRLAEGDFMTAVFNSPMNGSLSQGWDDLNSNAIFFQDCLEDVRKDHLGKWTPADYLLQCYISGKKKGVDLSEMDLGRALRNLPSFLREELISGALSERPGVEIEIPSALSNAQEHVDFIIKMNGQTVYVWSYLASKKAVGHLTQSKITEKRGRVLNGLNLLAPFDKAKHSSVFLDWWVPSKAYIDQLLKALEQPSQNYDDVVQLAKKYSGGNDSPFHHFLLFDK